jgi:hypothetical protein
MPLFRVIGFGLFLLIIAIAMPVVFAALTETILVFLQSAQQALLAAGILASYAGHIPPPLP